MLEESEEWGERCLTEGYLFEFESRDYLKAAFLKKLKSGETIVVAEGYVFEFERRGYLKAGTFVPEVVLEHPDQVKALAEEFVHAGTDVVLAFTYYGHRDKLRVIGREADLEKMNRKALQIAKDVARATGKLFAGNISNTTTYKETDAKRKEVEAIFKEQIEWAVEAGVDFIVAETFNIFEEAVLALECIKKYGKGVPAVVTLVATRSDRMYNGGPTYAEACRLLEKAGAAVVGLNCCRGPGSIMPVMKEIRQACTGPIACLPVVYRTTTENPTMQSLIDPVTGKQAFPVDLPAQQCSRTEIRSWATACKELGVQYIGLCCGNSSHYIREVAEVYKKNPPASNYSPDMSVHFMFGDKPTHDDQWQTDFGGQAYVKK